MNAKKTPVLPHKSSLYLLLLTVMGGVCVGTMGLLHFVHRQMQRQDDPRVAAVWIVGITRGSDLTLRRGNDFLAWLNAHGVHALGDAKIVSSRFGGDPNGIEIWFAYRSHLPYHRELECHRVGKTAFVDDLGQNYHGFLDFEDDYVGVYLPAYDHAAHRVKCTIRWMPRAPAPPEPVSRTMSFQIDLPSVPRILPPADQIPLAPVPETRQGVTVTVSDVRLGPPLYGGYSIPQRHLTFHLDVQGGSLADGNLEPYRLDHPTSVRFLDAGNQQNYLSIQDPYGVSLLSSHEPIVPLPDSRSQSLIGSKSHGDTWTTSVNGTGRGTDIVRFHLDVYPDSGGESLSFNPIVRVN